MCPLLFKILSQLALWSFNISIYRLGISKKLVTSGSQNMGDYSWVTWPYPEKNACFTFCILPVQLQKIPFPSRFRGDSLRWLLVDLPLWKIWLRQLGLLVPNSQYMEKKNMFQPPTSKLLEDPGVACESNMALSFGRNIRSTSLARSAKIHRCLTWSGSHL